MLRFCQEMAAKSELRRRIAEIRAVDNHCHQLQRDVAEPLVGALSEAEGMVVSPNEDLASRDAHYSALCALACCPHPQHYFRRFSYVRQELRCTPRLTPAQSAVM